MRKSNKKTVVAVLAAIAILCATAVPVWAYWTSNTQAAGGWVLETAAYDTELKEEVEGFFKHVRVENHDGSSGGVYVRARAFAPSGCALEYLSADHSSETAGEAIQDGSWSLGDDGWYYYSEPLPPGSATCDLDIDIGRPVVIGEQGTDFNVVVVYEAAPAAYDGNREPYADWDARLALN